MSTRSATSLKRRQRAPDSPSSIQGSTTTTIQSVKRPAKRNKTLRFNDDDQLRPHSPVNEDEDDTTVPSGDERDSDSDDSSDELKEVTLAIICYKGQIGAAYYDPSDQTLYLLEDTPEGSHFDLTKHLFDQVKPAVVLTSSRADEGLIQECQVHADENFGKFQVRPHREFTIDRGRDRLLSLRIFQTAETVWADDNDDNGSRVSRNAYNFMRRKSNGDAQDPLLKTWKASLRSHNFSSMDSQLCLSSVGALLDHLVRTNAASDLEGEGVGGLDVGDVKFTNLERCMLLNTDALLSLQVFAPENHAFVHSDRTKEGLSLFAILDHTKTKSGRSLLRRWLSRPSLNEGEITARLDAVECFLLSDNSAPVDAISKHLRGIGNIPRALSALRSGRATIREWTTLIKFTYHAFMLKETLSELVSAAGISVLEKVEEVLELRSFKDMGTMINETIDWEASLNESRVCVRYNIDPELDEKKRIYDGLSVFLAKVALRVGEGIPSEFSASLDVIYFPQLGYLITIPFRPEWRNEQFPDILPGWTFQFSTEEQLYFKNQDMQELDIHIGDLKSIIVDREIEIIHALQDKILEYDDAIKGTSIVCAELDCLISLATASSLYSFTRPTITQEKALMIKKGRHPLQELCEATFVPNDTNLVGGFGAQEASETEVAANEDAPRSVMICTGPNACGKSVYLKQVALIVILAQIGCYVPAEGATIGLIDKIFTRIQTKESVAKTQSAFMIDLSQSSLALRNCTSRSLIILDEFGKGTTSADGAGLLCGLLLHLLHSEGCPKVLAATHFHEIFHHNLLPPYLPIAYAHMEVLVTNDSFGSSTRRAQLMPNNEDDIESLPALGQQFTFLYRLVPGLCLKPYAAHCALLNGVPQPLVQRAQRVSDLLSKQNIAELLDEQMTEAEELELEEVERVTREFCSLDLRSCRQVKDGLLKILGRT